MKKLLLLISFFLWGVVGEVWSADYHISEKGNDDNVGSEEFPWRTISKANASLKPGDSVLIMNGNYNQQIRPLTSGLQDKYITYKPYPGHLPIISNVSADDRTAIILDEVSYIIVEGLTISGQQMWPNSNLNHWVKLYNSNYNIFKNNIFKYANGWHGFKLDGTSHHNQVLENRMDALGTIDDGTTKHVKTGDILIIKSAAKYNLVANNEMSRGGHNILRVDGSYNVISGNLFDNDWGGGLGYRSVVLTSSSSSAGRNLFEKNLIVNASGSKSSPDSGGIMYSSSMKVEGSNQIVRNNFLVQSIQEGIKSEARDGIPYVLNNRIYNNVFYGNGGPAWRTTFYTAGTSIDGNIFKNNIVYNHRQQPQNNNYDVGIGVAISKSGSQINGNQIVSNSFFKNTSGDTMFYIEGIGRKSLSWFEQNYPSNISGNYQLSPEFILSNPINPDDFKLKLGSNLIDKGSFLTKTQDSGTGTVVAVVDSNYFTNGFNIIEGDLIQVGNNSEAKILKVDYSNNKITLDSTISWSIGDGVSLRYAGSAPDIGAYEYGVDTSLSLPTPPNIIKLIQL